MPAPSSLPAKLSVDFTGVDIKKGGDYIPPGDYLTRVVGASVKSKQDDPQSKYISWLLEVQAPTSHKGKRVYLTTSLKREALWKLRQFLVDILGEEKVPAKALDIPMAKIVEAKPFVGITAEDDEYKGKTKTNVAGTFSRADWDQMSGEAAPATPAVAAAATTADDDSSDGEDMEELDLDDL
jgi:hypothetical protein